MIPVGIVSDNASAMAHAIEDYDEDDDDDVAGAAMFTEDPPANEDEAEEEEGEGNFFVHVRCWSHVFQLLIGDVAKQLPTAVEVLRKVLHISRSTRDHVARLRIIAGKSTTKLVIPTATRWNSQTRSAARILDFVCELQEAGVGLTVDEIVALKVFVICTAPFSWATTKSQSDHATIGTVRHLCSEIRDEFNTIKNQAQEFPESTRNMVLRVCAAAEAALLTREARYLTNTVTDALDTLESVNTLAASKWTALQKLVCSYYRTINVTRDVEPEISLFRFRSDDERFRSNEERNVRLAAEVSERDAGLPQHRSVRREVFSARRSHLVRKTKQNVSDIGGRSAVRSSELSQVATEGIPRAPRHSPTQRRRQQRAVATNAGKHDGTHGASPAPTTNQSRTTSTNWRLARGSAMAIAGKRTDAVLQRHCRQNQRPTAARVRSLLG
jgi:hypothetical protein